MNKLRMAYIGCGAVVERSHLPAILNCRKFSVSCLIDFNQDQRTRLAEQYQVVNHGESLEKFIQEFDVAVIATPSATHYHLVKQLLNLGKHVIVEKPLATDYVSAKLLVELAQEKKLTLSVSLVRRFLPHFKLFKSLLSTNLLGDIQTFTIEEGNIFNWPVQGDGFYDSSVSGGGVLLDNGAHLLDACLWWLGNYKKVTYYDDAQGGVEAECHLELTLENGIRGTVQMSRLRQLSNNIHIFGDRGKLSMDLASGDIDLMINDSMVDLRGSAFHKGKPVQVQTGDLFERQYHSFYNAVTNNDVDGESDLVLGRDCLWSIKLIEECYENRQLMSNVVI